MTANFEITTLPNLGGAVQPSAERSALNPTLLARRASQAPAIKGAGF
jgi:hypothetical protein